MEALLVLIWVASAAIAFVVARWWTLAVPVTAIAAFYLGLRAEWWGDGVGDGWPFVMALMMGAGVVAAALGIAARRLAGRSAEPGRAR